MNKLSVFLKISACIILLFSSCKKDEIQKEVSPDILSNTPAEFRSWFNKRFINNQISIHGLRNTIDSAKSLNSAPKLLLEPLWAEAKNYSRGDSILAEVPLKNGNIVFSKNQIDARAFDFSKVGSLTSLLFLQTDSKVRGVLMTIIGDEAYLQGDIKKLKNNTFRKKEKDFSGDVLYHNSKGLFINGYRYYDGKVVGYISPGKASNSSEKKKFANATVKDVICETYKQVTTYRQCDGGCVYWSETIFFQYCYIGDGLSDQGPTGCGGDGTKDLMQSVDGSVCSDEDPVDDYPLDIINKVTDPCLRPLVASLINNNVSGKISEIISKLNGDAKVTVTFTDVELTSNNKPAMIGPISVSNGIYPITLSRLHLKETTRENVTAVIIHEVIHAFLNYSGQGNAIDGIEHETIALNYVNPMANYLIQLHGISERDAIGLAWSGLSDSNSYINNDIFNYSQGNLTKAEIQDTYRNFISGKSGILVCE